MEKVVFRLAEQTARYLAEHYGGQPDLQSADVPYYNRFNILFDEVPEVVLNEEALFSEINRTLSIAGKIQMLLIIHDALIRHYTPAMEEALLVLYKAIGIDGLLMKKFRNFIMEDDIHTGYHKDYLLLTPENADNKEMLEGSWIEGNASQANESAGIHHINLPHYLLAMFVEPVRAYVIRCIDFQGKLFDQDMSDITPFRWIQPGSELTINGASVLTYAEMKRRFHLMDEHKVLSFFIDHIQYTNPQHIKEIHSFSSQETTGQIIGIVGREGVGKSTLLKLLAGKIRPDSGNIFINGYDLWKHKYLLKGLIGFVPEEDLLFEELSVSDNLKLAARLYYSHFTKKEIEQKVDHLLNMMDLTDIKNVMVGNFNSKDIQPGQRRLLNIALELLREPQILLVDNALSGLGMSDACRVIKILHDYSFRGNLVITSISQVDSETFKLFDKIWILDTGGYPVYNGTVKGASEYIYGSVEISEKESNTDPAQLLDWIGYRCPDPASRTWKRVLEPFEWHKLLLAKQIIPTEVQALRNALPARILKIPNLETQLLIFSIRNFKCKFSRLHEIIKALLVGPFIALIFSVLLRQPSDNYTLFSNVNIPLFQFVSVVVALFLGLIASVDEINREKNISEKEEYMEFSRFSYLNSKILYLFPVIAIQIFLYTLTANLILGLNELFFIYWIVLFSAACFGSLLGLVLSAAIDKMSLLYKAAVPLIISMQLLLGGGIVSYEKLNLGNLKYTPLIGDLMVSRWGYEALAVEQFKNNGYEKHRYALEKKLNQAAFCSNYVIPELDRTVQKIVPGISKDSLHKSVSLLENELGKIGELSDVFRFEYLHNLSEITESETILRETKDYITYLSIHFNDKKQQLNEQLNRLDDSLVISMGTASYAQLKNKLHNQALEDVVIHQGGKEYKMIHNEIIRKSGMIYQDPASNFGRACLYSPTKRFNGVNTETIWFNVSTIWLFTFICYIWVLFDFSSLFKKNTFLTGL